MPITAARAIRLATMRAATDSVGLSVQISAVGEQVQGLDDLLASLAESQLMVRLDRADAPAGFMACDATLVAAVVEVQTTGKIAQAPPEARLLTNTDALMVARFLTIFWQS